MDAVGRESLPPAAHALQPGVRDAVDGGVGRVYRATGGRSASPGAGADDPEHAAQRARLAEFDSAGGARCCVGGAVHGGYFAVDVR